LVYAYSKLKNHNFIPGFLPLCDFDPRGRKMKMGRKELDHFLVGFSFNGGGQDTNLEFSFSYFLDLLLASSRLNIYLQANDFLRTHLSFP
jgi:hypothetical protein